MHSVYRPANETISGNLCPGRDAELSGGRWLSQQSSGAWRPLSVQEGGAGPVLKDATARWSLLLALAHHTNQAVGTARCLTFPILIATWYVLRTD